MPRASDNPKSKIENRNFLDPVALQRAEVLGLDARQIVEGYMAGAHKSPYRGFAIEFAQHREYVAGDDTRHLDWKVLGRSDRYYIKQYEQETNYVAHLLLDGSESMRYGSGKLTKFDYARTMTACLAYLILLQRDAVSLGIFDDNLRATYKRTNNLSSIHEIMHLLAEFEPSEKTQLPAVLTRLAQTIKRKGIVIVISDFLDDEEAVMRGIQHLRFAGSEVIMMQVLDPYEITFPFEGPVEFRGLEGAGKVETRPSDIRASYLEAFGGFVEKLRIDGERAGCHYLQVNTAQPWHEVLSGYLAMRAR